MTYHFMYPQISGRRIADCSENKDTALATLNRAKKRLKEEIGMIETQIERLEAK